MGVDARPRAPPTPLATPPLAAPPLATPPLATLLQGPSAKESAKAAGSCGWALRPDTTRGLRGANGANGANGADGADGADGDAAVRDGGVWGSMGRSNSGGSGCFAAGEHVGSA